MAESTLLLIVAAALALAGFGWFAMAMQTHWVQIHGSRPHSVATARRLRVGGAAALGISLALCLKVDHPSMAVLVWFMLLAGTAVAIAMTLSTRPQCLRWLWPSQRAPFQ